MSQKNRENFILSELRQISINLITVVRQMTT